MQYCFEAIMANEFYNMDIQCEPPSIVPDGPNAVPGHQSCAIQGSTPDSTIVRGANYIRSAYTYTRSHLWRNFGIVIGWFIFFVALTVLGMERQKPNKGGMAVTVFKRGEAPKEIERTIKEKKKPEDEESGERDTATHGSRENGSGDSMEKVEGIAENTSIFTWQNVTYTIPYKGGQRKLLQDVQGYVKPGRLTALMGASGSGSVPQIHTTIYIDLL